MERRAVLLCVIDLSMFVSIHGDFWGLRSLFVVSFGGKVVNSTQLDSETIRYGAVKDPDKTDKAMTCFA